MASKRAVEFDTTEYEFSHGHRPGMDRTSDGFGYWIFQIDGARFDFRGRWGEARKAATAAARLRRPVTIDDPATDAATVEVLP